MQTKAILYWLSGVVVSSRATVLQEVIHKSTSNPTELLNIREFRNLEERLAFDEIDGFGYFKEICEQSGLNLTPDALETLVLSLITLNHSLMDLNAHLRSDIEKWLIVDVPETWLRMVKDNQRLNEEFPDDRRVNLIACGFKKFTPDFLSGVPKILAIPLEECILVDEYSKRAVDAINHGLSSIIFVDCVRLEREFFLRKLLTARS